MSTRGAPQARVERLAHTENLWHEMFAPHAKLSTPVFHLRLGHRNNMTPELMEQNQNGKSQNVFAPAVATSCKITRLRTLIESHMTENNDCNILQQA